MTENTKHSKENNLKKAGEDLSETKIRTDKDQWFSWAASGELQGAQDLRIFKEENGRLESLEDFSLHSKR